MTSYRHTLRPAPPQKNLISWAAFCSACFAILGKQLQLFLPPSFPAVFWLASRLLGLLPLVSSKFTALAGWVAYLTEQGGGDDPRLVFTDFGRVWCCSLYRFIVVGVLPELTGGLLSQSFYFPASQVHNNFTIVYNHCSLCSMYTHTHTPLQLLLIIRLIRG